MISNAAIAGWWQISGRQRHGSLRGGQRKWRFGLPDGKLARTIGASTQDGCQQTTEFAAISANRAAEGNQHHGDSIMAVDE